MKIMSSKKIELNNCNLTKLVVFCDQADNDKKLHIFASDSRFETLFGYNSPTSNMPVGFDDLLVGRQTNKDHFQTFKDSIIGNGIGCNIHSLGLHTHGGNCLACYLFVTCLHSNSNRVFRDLAHDNIFRRFAIVTIRPVVFVNRIREIGTSHSILNLQTIKNIHEDEYLRKSDDHATADQYDLNSTQTQRKKRNTRNELESTMSQSYDVSDCEIATETGLNSNRLLESSSSSSPSSTSLPSSLSDDDVTINLNVHKKAHQKQRRKRQNSTESKRLALLLSEQLTIHPEAYALTNGYIKLLNEPNGTIMCN